MLLITPFFLISIYSFFFCYIFKIQIIKSYLIVSLIFTYFIYILGKIGFLELSNWIIYLLTPFILLVLLKNKNFFQKSHYHEFLLVTIIFLIIIWYCRNLFLYKYDDFSEYGIIPKLTFFENILPINVDYLDKGTHTKINIISLFQYFFIKNSFSVFNEKYLLITNNFFKVLLILNILSFLNLNFFKKLLTFVSIYFLIYSLTTGFDKLYVDSIISLIIPLLFLTFKKNLSKVDALLFILLFITIPSIKFSGIIVICGLSLIFISLSVIEKNFKNSLFILFCLILSYFLNSFHHNKDVLLNKSLYNKPSEEIYQNRNQFYNINNELKVISREYRKGKIDNKYRIEILIVNFKELSEKSIYHTKTFLVFNKIFERLQVDLKFYEFKLNLWIWIILISILTSIVFKRDKNIVITSLLYILFIISYFIILVNWAIMNNLVNPDLTIEQSWQRHLGVLIFGYILYLIIKILNTYNFGYFNYSIILSIIIMITVPNSFRNFLSFNIILKDEYWNKSFNMRNEIRYLAEEIQTKIPKYSKVIVSNIDNFKGYFYPVLRYELIDINTIKNDDYRLKDFINKLDKKRNDNNNLFILISDNQNINIEVSKIFDLNKVYYSKILSNKNSILYKLENN